MKKISFLTLIVFLIDRITKYFIMTNLNYLENIDIIPNFFSLTYVKNTGGAFSILTGHLNILVIISLISLLAIFFYLKKCGNYNTINIISWGLILGGLFGNLFDRIIYNGVIDFLSFTFASYHYPVFNVSDIAIVIGVLLMLILEVRGNSNENRT